MSVLHVIVSVLTFPGTIFRQILSQFILSFSKVKIHSMRCFSMYSPCGHIDHDKITGAAKNFILAFIPFLITLVVGTSILVPASLKIFNVHKVDFFVIIFFWFGFSLVCNMFPEYTDAKALWGSFYGKNSKANIIFKIILFPFNALLFAGSWLMHTGLNLITTVAYAFFVPWGFVYIFYVLPAV